MSPENLEIVRRSFEAWDRRHHEAAARDFSPDIEMDATERVLNPAVYAGLEGALRCREEIAETWDDFHVEIEDMLPAGDQVVLLVRTTRQGRGSGVVQANARAAWVVSVSCRDGPAPPALPGTARGRRGRGWHEDSSSDP